MSMLTKDRTLTSEERSALTMLTEQSLSQVNRKWLERLLTENEDNRSGCKPSKELIKQVRAILFSCTCQIATNGTIEKLDFKCPFHCYTGEGKTVKHAPLHTTLDMGGKKPRITKRFMFFGNGKVRSQTKP